MTLASRNEQYDAQALEVMRRSLRHDSIGVDVGAHEGRFLAMMEELAPDASHFAFEPLPHLAALLQERFPRAHVLPYALSDHTGVATFQFVRNDPGYSGLRLRTYDRADVEIDPIQVPVRRLDETIPDDQVIAFIKLDVEGGEADAMRGGVHTIRRSRPVIVFEAGEKSTAHYGVTPEQLYRLVDNELDCHLSTMENWLAHAPPMSLATFLDRYQCDFYFIAYPR